jgi:hypothetical protein
MPNKVDCIGEGLRNPKTSGNDNRKCISNG